MVFWKNPKGEDTVIVLQEKRSYRIVKLLSKILASELKLSTFTVLFELKMVIERHVSFVGQTSNEGYSTKLYDL